MPDSKPLVIVGAGALGREVCALVEAINDDTPRWNVIGFVDDDDELQGGSVLGYPVHGSVHWLSQQDDPSYIIAIGDGQTRRSIANTLASSNVSPTSLQHPSVSIHRTTSVDPGTLLCNGAAPTVNVEIGPHVVIDQQCTIGHDSTLEAFTTLYPGVQVSGSVHVENGVTLGANSVVLPGMSIGARATVGAGAVVTNDLPAGCTAVGIPARPQS